MKAYKIIPYIARTFTVLTLAFVLLFVAAHVFGAEETGDLNLISRKDKVTFFFFPVVFTLGLAISLWKKLLGGVLSMLGIFALYIIRPDLMQTFWFNLFLIPGILYILSWWLYKRSHTENV